MRDTRTGLRTAIGTALLSLSLVAGCGPGAGRPSNKQPPGMMMMGGNGLVITPASAMLTVNGGPVTQQFAATWNGQDVTQKVLWQVGDKTAGNIDMNGLFTSNYPLTHGGPVPVTAAYMNMSGGASVSLFYVAPDVLDKGAAGDAATSFGGGASTDPSERPVVIYPFDGSMLARNINQMNLQWSGSSKDHLFRIHLVSQFIDSAIYVGAQACTPKGNALQCAYQPSDAAWQAVAVSSAGQPVTLTISGTAGNGQPVADSPGETLHFSPSDVKGGFYYFSPSILGLKRLPFGASQATNFVTQGGGFNCTGCHTVSHDGKKVASTFWGGDGTGGMVDGSNGKSFLIKPQDYRQNPTVRWNFATFNQDGSLLLTNWAGVLTLRDGTTGAKMMDVPANITGGAAVMPEWSPDGMQVVFVQLPPEGKLGKDFRDFSNQPCLTAGDWIVGDAGSIATMKYTNGAFQQAQVIVPSAKNSEYHYYPSWSPDSQWLVFVTAKFPGLAPNTDKNLGSCTQSAQNMTISYDQDTARLRLVQAMPNAPVIELLNATHKMNFTTSWPKFAPFVQGNFVFFTFSAKFDYGFVVRNEALVDHTARTPQLWMAAIDLSKAMAENASDPSYPPFWLPFQNPGEKNHSGIWTNDVACTMNSDCPSEFTCQNNMCMSNGVM